MFFFKSTAHIGSGKSLQWNTDSADTDHTAAANDSNDGRSYKAQEVEQETTEQQTNILFNYSCIKLSKAMQSLLNRALNFAVLPLKLDITEMLVDFNRFARAAFWQEYWYRRDINEPYAKPIFKSHKINLPKNHKTHNGLKTYLGAIKSEIMDHQNRNKVKSNLPEEEIEALSEFIKLQKDHKS